MEDRWLHVEVVREAGGYWAQVHEWGGCFASGENLGELIEALEEAIAMYVTADGQPAPVLDIRLCGLDLRVGSAHELTPAREELPGLADTPFRSRDPHPGGRSPGRPRREHG